MYLSGLEEEEEDKSAPFCPQSSHLTLLTEQAVALVVKWQHRDSRSFVTASPLFARCLLASKTCPADMSLKVKRRENRRRAWHSAALEEGQLEEQGVTLVR